MGQLTDPACECNAKQFHTAADGGGAEDGLAICCPDGYVAAAIVVVRDIQKLGDATIAAAIDQFFQTRSIGLYDVWMAVVVFAGNEQQPFAIG